MNKSFKGADLLYKNALNATSAAETLSSLKQSLTVIKVLVKVRSDRLGLLGEAEVSVSDCSIVL